MIKPIYEEGSSIAEARDINTPAGRRVRFNERVDELMRPTAKGGKGLTLEAAVLEMRTGGNADDRALLEAMGEKSSHFRDEALRREKFNRDLDRIAQENIEATKTAQEEVAAALSRNIAFNSRMDELTRKGFSTNQAILQMRADPDDAALLAAMNGPIA